MSALPAIVEEHPAGHTEVAGAEAPTLLGITGDGWVYVSLTIFFLLAIFVAKAPRRIAEGLDAQIAEKRRNLDEADRIRAEAQALLEEARAQHAASARDAEKMIEQAREQAAHIVEQAETDTASMIARRAAMAEDKIAAAERNAIEQLRREAAGAAAAAAEAVIAEEHGEKEDRQLADRLIAEI